MATDDPRQRPIGVFDSGLGGLTVLRALHERLPGEDLVYFGDTARVPYGTKGAATVRAFARQDAGFLVSLGVKMVVVACNTASAFALDHLGDVCPVPVLGVIDPGVDTALRRTRGGAVGVIGTSGTIRSGRYQAGLLQRLGETRVVAQECPLFVPLVEEGLVEHPLTELAVHEYLAPLRDAGVDTLILGCTHYPVLKPVIGRYMGEDVALVDSAAALAEAAHGRLAAAGLQRAVTGAGAAGGRLTFYLSDFPWKFAEVGARFLGSPIENVITVNLDDLERTGGLPALPREQREDST
ncbi:MAG: glutamate racemase [Candidatus Krumholzibacteriia bacterium]